MVDTTETIGNDHQIDSAVQQPSAAARSRYQTLMVAICCLVVLFIYVWLISIGSWTQWPTYTDYYDQLANAFRHGQLALEAKPSPALLALANPYDPDTRANIPFPLDVSLYRGKFYLYFGPVPALILLLPKLVVFSPIGDQYLVFLFIYGIFIAEALLLLRLRNRFFPRLPHAITAASILLLGLIAPFTWVLGKPAVYDASIAGGQLFFLAGLYMAFDALDATRIRAWRLAVIGLLWGIAPACRITFILPVGFMLLAVAVELVRRQAAQRSSKRVLPLLASMALTFGICLAALGWYNWARFGSALETGIRYQLAGPDLQKYRDLTFSGAYVIQNLYNYALNPPKHRPGFPYYISGPGEMESLVASIALPVPYHTQRLTGMLYTSSFILLAIVPLLDLSSTARSSRSSPGNDHMFRWMVVSLFGSFLSSFVPFLFYFWAAERFLIDFLPCLALLGILGWWMLRQHAAQKPAARALYRLGPITLVVASLIASSVLAVSPHGDAFKELLRPHWWSPFIHLFHP